MKLLRSNKQGLDYMDGSLSYKESLSLITRGFLLLSPRKMLPLTFRMPLMSDIIRFFLVCYHGNQHITHG